MNNLKVYLYILNYDCFRWARSRSLKERTSSLRKDPSLSRSSSLKEPKPSNLLRRRSISRCSTARSRTSSICKTSSECSLDDDQMGKVKAGYSKLNQFQNSLSASPDSKQAVLGWIENNTIKASSQETLFDASTAKRPHIKDDITLSLCADVKSCTQSGEITHIRQAVQRLSGRRKHKPQSIQITAPDKGSLCKLDNLSPSSSPGMVENNRYFSSTNTSL